VRKRERLRASIKGHLVIRCYETEEDLLQQTNYKVLLDIDNAVHRENAALLVARAITDRPDGAFYAMWFGNGGATVDPLGNVILNPPNVTGQADLYSPLFFEVVDDRMDAPSGNYMTYTHITGTFVSDAIIHCVVGKNQPATNTTTNLVFNEIALKTADDLLITHLTFTPITKAPGNLIEIIYTITVTATGETVDSVGQTPIGLSAHSGMGSMVADKLVPLHLVGNAGTSTTGTVQIDDTSNETMTGQQASSGVGHLTVQIPE
jgi:hypothetical protein